MNSKLDANIVMQQGTPVLQINGKPTRPLIFFFNTEVETGRKFLTPQVKLASEAGVHLYSLCVPWPWPGESEEAVYARGEAFFDAFLEADPDALFIPRLRTEGSAAWMAEHPNELVQHADGSKADMTCLASELWWNTLTESYARAIRHFENSRFAERIIGYHPCGQNTGEWFHYEYWLKGPDYSAVNAQAFRRWLTARYGDDGALQAAWGDDRVTLDTAMLPPMPGLASAPCGLLDAPFASFLALPEQQPLCDFHFYTNELMARRVMSLATLTKQTAGPNKLVLLFYGYFFEMHGATSGHFDMETAIECPDADIFVSPLSYMDRQPGGSGGFMTAIDSLPVNGKLWLVENDYRTDILDISSLPEWITESGLGPRAKDQAETLGVITREFGGLLTHRCGTWWMDLIAAGAYADPVVWRRIKETLSPLYDTLIEAPAPYTPDVAVIVDEASLNYLNYPAIEGQACYSPIYDFMCRKAREVFGRSGVTCGYYYLKDFLAGQTPKCGVYWFPDLFAVDAARIERILARLDEEGAAAVWQYAPGYLLDGKPSLAGATQLTGMALAADSGPMASTGAGSLEGCTWGEDLFLTPRIACADAEAAVLGTYQHGGGVSAAIKQHGRHTSVFIGSAKLTDEMAGKLLARLGAHRWAAQGGAVQCDGRTLFVHYGEGGEKEIILPEGVTGQPILPAGDTITGAAHAPFAPGETRIFLLQK